MTIALRVLFGIACVLLAGSLFWMNDITTLWSGSEAAMIAAAVEGGDGWLPQMILNGLWEEGRFVLRLPGVGLFLGLLVGLYFGMRPLFGQMTALLAVWLLGGSLVVPALAKVASGDIWAFVFQSLTLLTILRFFKQPTLWWRVLFYTAAALALWVHPLSSGVLILVVSTILYMRHPQGKQLLSLAPWILVLIGLPVFYFLPFGNWGTSQFGFDYFNTNYFKYLGYNLLGILPFVGFVVAGLVETVQKARKGEELALINLSLLIAALAAQSMALQVVLALLAAKQLQAYFVANYPYKSYVRGVAVMQLIVAFCVIAFALMAGFYELRGVGFRSAISAGGVYWMASFLGVIGLYGMNRRLIWGSPLMGGLAATFLFWVQIYPVLETQRNWATEAIAQTKASGHDTLFWEAPAYERFPNTIAIGKMNGVEVVTDKKTQYPAQLLPDSVYLKLDVQPPADTLPGWTDEWQKVTWFLID
jgi:hypothetical protein